MKAFPTRRAAQASILRETTNDGVNKYLYDAEGRMISDNYGATTYLYDGDGFRVAKQSSGSVAEVYFYDVAGRLVVKTTGSLYPNRTEIYGGSRHFATYGDNWALVYDHANWLGTEEAHTDVNGNVCQTISSLAFGDDQQPTGSCTNITTPIFFTGKERDSESGNDYFGARYYGSSMGRFLSPDPSMEGAILELPQTWNKYSYEYNRPLYGTDPDGRCPPCIGAIVGGVVEGGFDLGKQLYNNGGNLSGVSWGEVGANAVGGAVAGGLAVATGGASLVESAVVGDLAAGATSNIVGNIVTRSLDPNNTDDVLSAQDISEDALAGFVGGAGGHIAADMVHIPPEPRGVKTRSGTVYRRQLAKRQAAVNSRNMAIAGQFVRSGITSSLTTHSTNGIWDWLMFAPPPEPKATVTTSECDSLPDGSTRCQ